MAQFWRRTEFQVLLKTWNKKLEESGFDDHEVELKEDRALKQRASNCYRQATEEERESKLEYYSFLGQLVNETNFPSELERLVLTKFSEGFLIKEIAQELSRNGIKKDRRIIRFIIRRWEKKWGIRAWSIRQMGLKIAIKL